MPFPFSLIDSFDIEIPSSTVSDPVRDLTVAAMGWLAKQRASAVSQTPSGISFKAGLFRAVTGWNILVAVSSGELEIDRREAVIRVTYRLRFTELFIAATAGVTVLVGFSGVAAPLGAAGTVSFFVVGWLWLFGMNYLLAKHRIPRALRAIAQQATGGKLI